MAPLTYRSFLPEDWPQVRDFLLREAEAPSQYATDVLARERIVAWLAHDGEDIVGWILTHPFRADDDVERGGIDDVVVAATHRRRGIGRRLMGLAEAHYRQSRAGGMQLTVRADNDAALPLYESMGYAVVQRRLRMWKEFT